MTKEESRKLQVNHLLELLAEKDLSQSDLAKMIGMNPPYLNRCIKGEKGLSPRYAKAINSIFTEYSIEYLMGETEYRNRFEKTLWDTIKDHRRSREVLDSVLQCYGYEIHINPEFGEFADSLSQKDRERYYLTIKDEPNLMIVTCEGKKPFYTSEAEVKKMATSICEYTEFLFMKMGHFI